MRSRTRYVAERRLSLVKLLVALFVARVVVTIVELTEQRITWWSLLITLAIGIEAWRAWSVARVARRSGETPAPLPDTVWNRILTPAERVGPAIVYALTALFVVVSIVLLVLGNPHDALLDVAIVAREITTFAVVGVLLAGYLSVRAADSA
jgi:hypothetical protein